MNLKLKALRQIIREEMSFMDPKNDDVSGAVTRVKRADVDRKIVKWVGPDAVFAQVVDGADVYIVAFSRDDDGLMWFDASSLRRIYGYVPDEYVSSELEKIGFFT